MVDDVVVVDDVAVVVDDTAVVVVDKGVVADVVGPAGVVVVAVEEVADGVGGIRADDEGPLGIATPTQPSIVRAIKPIMSRDCRI